LTWTVENGCRHNKVDDGEDRPGAMKMTPILVPDGVFAGDLVRKKFEAAAESLDPALRKFVLSGMNSCSSRFNPEKNAAGGPLIR